MKKILVGLAAASILTLTATANDIPYRYADLTFNTYDDADGYSFGASFDIANNFYAIGEFSKIELERINIDLVDLQIGVGYHYSIAPETDVLAELSFINSDFDGGSGASIDDSGYVLGFGLRKLIKPNIEFSGKVEYVEVFEGSETDFEVAGIYYFENQFGLGASYQTRGNSDLDGFVIRGRYRF